jgi:hypothetical protein
MINNEEKKRRTMVESWFGKKKMWTIASQFDAKDSIIHSLLPFTVPIFLSQ